MRALRSETGRTYAVRRDPRVYTVRTHPAWAHGQFPRPDPRWPQDTAAERRRKCGRCRYRLRASLRFILPQTLRAQLLPDSDRLLGRMFSQRIRKTRPFSLSQWDRLFYIVFNTATASFSF